jgi:hypothetical protein
MLAHRWTFDTGETASGRTVELPKKARSATLSVTDSAGTVATATYARGKPAAE